MYEDENELETVVVTDEAGRELACTVEHSLDIDGQNYVLLLPLDAPIEIFAWKDTTDIEAEDAVLIEEEAVIDRIFPTAKAVLEELNLTLKRTAVTLTVEGDLPLDNEDEEEFDEENFADGEEELQHLADFYYEDQEYSIYAPLDPFLILARMDSANRPQLLSTEELKQIEPYLPTIEAQFADQVFEDLD